MCGITGIVSPSPNPGDLARVQAMTDLLEHRGPDASGVRSFGSATLGHRRLSIIDLSERGTQPMVLEGQVALTYNGEIYNHVDLRRQLERAGHSFRTGTDTEVLLRGYQEWGAGVLERLNGMFAFGIWDLRQQTLLLARDPFGQKPLYYASLPGGGLAFASELRSIEQVLRASGGLEIDRGAVAKYLCFDGFPEESAVYAGVRRLPPATWFRWGPGQGQPQPERYWRRTYAAEGRIPGPSEAADQVWSRLCSAVDRHLMGDVPLGVFLSGGIDSSAVLAAMATRVDARRIRTFSIGFEEASYDESEAARLVADQFGVQHDVKILGGRELLDLVPTVLAQLDEPLADASVIPTYALSRFAREEVAVALGGDGGDELFAGYDTVVAERAARYYLRTPSLVRTLVRHAVQALPTSSDKRSLQFRASRFVRGLDASPLVRNQRWFGSFLPEEASRLVQGAPGPGEIYGDLEGILAPPGEQGPLELWTSIYMPTCVLTKVDRASMAVSLEVRAPFLDLEFAEYVTRLPYHYKLRGLTRKWILKRALQGRLPREILHRSKQGFGVPCGEWLRGPLRARATELFSARSIDRGGLFEPEEVGRLFTEHLSGRRDHRKKLWSLFVFLSWAENRANP